MKKITIITSALAVMFAAAVIAEFAIVPIAAPIAGDNIAVPTHLATVGKVVAIEALNIVSNKTIVLSRVDGAVTNVITTQTTTLTDGSREVFDLSSSGYFWLAKGETWLRTGTETNATVRLIVDQ